MADRLVSSWRLMLNSLAVVAVIAATFLFLEGTTEPGRADNSYLPPMTMVYETNGPSVNGVQTREVRRLEYRSRTDGKETVIEAPNVDVRSGNFQGVFNNAGSYTQLRYGKLTEFDVFTNSYREQTIDPNTIHLPNAAMQPYRLDLLAQMEDIEFTSVDTEVTVCYRDDCEEDVQGLLHVHRGVERVFLADPRWDIPLRIGDSAFVVRELRIEDERP
jgi:hypothetical protein